MNIREISFFNEFNCAMGACEETCCAGWLIPLEREDCARFLDTHGRLKVRLMFAMSEHSVPVFNSSSRTCPFHTKEGLCELQLARGHDFIPEVCRSYPRFHRNYGEFGERYIDLSCIEGVRLFMRHIDDLTLTYTEGDIDCALSVTNDDTAFLYALDKCRSDMISALRGVSDLNGLISILNAIDRYARSVQEAFLKGDEQYLDRVPFIYNVTDDSPEDSAEQSHDCDASIFPLSASEIDFLLHTDIHHRMLKKSNPRLYTLFTLYHRKYYRRLAYEKGWSEAYNGFLAENPQMVRYLAAYYSYYLYLYFFRIYEDYSFVKHVRMGMIHISLLLMLCVIYESEHGTVSDEDIARITAVYNRRAYFNDTVSDEMYKVFERRYTDMYTTGSHHP